MKKKLRRALHLTGDHRGCKVRIEPVPDYYDTTRKYIAGPQEIIHHIDGSTEYRRDVYDVTTLAGEPVYSGKTLEVHH